MSLNQSLSEILEYLKTAKSTLPMACMSEKEKIKFKREFGPAVGAIDRFIVFERDDARRMIEILRKLQYDVNAEGFPLAGPD
jgi:hypothetical protein